ncbi:MAG: TRAP transporter small permease [Pseudomonadota bacterium]
MDLRDSYPAPLRLASRVIDVILAAGGAAIVVIVFTNATLRGTAGFDLAWSLEVVAFLLLWLTFLGCAAATARGSHMRVTDVVASVVPVRLRRPLNFVIDLAVIAILCALIFHGYRIAAHTWAQETTVLYWPVGLFYASMPVGMVATLAFHLFNIYLGLRAAPATEAAS